MSAPVPPPCLQAACDYLARGWSTIPLCPPDHLGVPGQHEESCTTPGKRPLYPWKEYQTQLPREAELKIFWARNKHSNVGIVMGPISGLIGLDIDGSAGAAMLREVSAGAIPDTLEFLTPNGGRRLLFRWPGDGVRIRSFAGADGSEALRVLALGSQTVAPPSMHHNGGIYTWVKGHGPGEIEAAACPQWVFDLSESAKPQAESAKPQAETHPTTSTEQALRRARGYLQRCDPAISGAGGHNQTFNVACKLVKGFVLPADDAVSLMLSDYNPRCQPPWTEAEIRHKVLDAVKAPGEIGTMYQSLRADAAPLAGNGNGNGNGHKEPKPRPPKPTTLKRFDSITAKEIVWLWPGWIPLGKITMLDGDPGLGKSTLLLDLAARISVAGIMPDNSQGIAGNVIILSAEDADDDTIKPRLIAAEANHARIHSLPHIGTGDDESPPAIPNNLPEIEQAIKDAQARLLIIDPLMAFLDKVDANKDQEIRRALFKLSKIAERQQCAVICMRHLNKHSTGKAIYRGNSSIGIIGHARAGLLVAVDPDDDQKRILAVTKCNLAAKPTSLRFILDPIGKVCRIGWAGTSNYQADQLVQAPDTEKDKEEAAQSKAKIEQCMELITDLLRHGPVQVRTVKKQCSDAGFSHRTMERAANKLKLEVTKITEAGRHTYSYELHP